MSNRERPKGAVVQRRPYDLTAHEIHPDERLTRYVRLLSAFACNLPYMQALLRTAAALVTAALLLDAATGVLAGDEQSQDHDLARKAVLEGRIRPLTEITEAVKSKISGEILSVQIEIDDQKRFVYEFDIITADGKLKEVDVDAATAAILKIEDDE